MTTANGSPPRAWGRRAPLASPPPTSRFTPTRVGTTLGRPSDEERPPGSPPRAWGRRGRRLLARRRHRFTPTRVGTTSRVMARRAARCGSPPRAWGRLGVPLDRHVPRRFTPTRVGTTLASGGADPGSYGSPPRAWGRPQRLGVARQKRRFTPTRVGTTDFTTPEAASAAVHPHARGDDLRPQVVTSGDTGSPPRAWGRPEARFDERDRSRFTPTRVGTTSPPPTSRPPNSVHPHARGDDASVFCGRVILSGSPPRAWGRPSQARRPPARPRFTPTRVGTTVSWREATMRIAVATQQPHGTT